MLIVCFFMLKSIHYIQQYESQLDESNREKEEYQKEVNELKNLMEKRESVRIEKNLFSKFNFQNFSIGITR